MSRVTSCPRCARQVSLPPGDDASAWVRCPLCDAQYPVQAALDYVPPLLEIVPPPALGTADETSQAVELLPHEDWTQPAHASRPEAAVAPEMTVPGGMAAAAGAVSTSAAVEPSADVFDAVIGREQEDHATAAAHPPVELASGSGAGGEVQHSEDDVPFIAETEHDRIEYHAATGDAMAEHVVADHEVGGAEMAFHDAASEEDHFGEDEFRFADDGSAEHEIEPSEFGAVHDSPHEGGAQEPHALGDIATIAAKPPKKKRKVPLAVRLIGIGIFFGIGAVGCYIVAAAFLYFGVADVPEFSRGLFPDVLVAQSLKQQRTSGKNNRRPATPPQTTTSGQNPSDPDVAQTTSTVADTNADSKNQPPAADKSVEKPADKSAPADTTAAAAAGSDKTAPKPVAADSAPSGKADPQTNPFENPKPGDSDAAKDDAAKLDPLASTAKTPSLDLPPVKPSGKKPDSTATPSPDKSADEPKPVERSVQKPAAAATEKPVDTIAPKSDVSYSIDDLTSAMSTADRTSATLAEAVKINDENTLKGARVANFRAMSHLATVETFAKATDSKEAERLATLKSQIAASLGSSAAATPDEREMIGGYARIGLGSKARKESGLLMAGMLKKIEPHGKYFESQLELPGGKAPVVLVTPEKPTAVEGSDVILLGAVINEPVKNLPGYEGAADTVIFSEVTVAAPKGEPAPQAAK